MRARPPWIKLSELFWTVSLGLRGTGVGIMVSVDARGASSVSVAAEAEDWVYAGDASGLCSCATCSWREDGWTTGLISSLPTTGVSVMSMWTWLGFLYTSSSSCTGLEVVVSGIGIDIDGTGAGVGGCDRGLTGIMGGCRGLE